VKRMIVWCSVVFIFLVSARWSQAQKTDGTAKAVAALEARWLESQKTNNPALIAPSLADKFVSTSSDGKMSSKADWAATAKSTKYSSADYSDLKVTVFGGTAIATGIERLKGTDGSGKPVDVNERWTDTWVKMPSGKWQCVASHQSATKT
jgi:ketosteroid isomerase-like protein